MLIPPPVRAPVIVWLAAVAAGVVETLVHLVEPDPPTVGDVLVRGAVYLAVAVVVLSLRTGSAMVRWVLALGLGGVGTLSLLLEPVSWLADGGSPWTYLATASPTTLMVVGLRAIHVAAVGVAVGLMFRPSTSRYVRRSRSQRIADNGGCGKTRVVGQHLRGRRGEDPAPRRSHRGADVG